MPDDDLQERRLDYLKRHGFNSDHLASFVEDQKVQAANAINNRGLEAQLDYLMKCMTWGEMVAALEEQRKVLIRYGIKCEARGNLERKE